MPQSLRSEISGQYVGLIAAYLEHNYADRKIDVRQQVDLGTSIIGKRRKLDILVVHPPSGKALGLECKYQGVSGTADEKIPYALGDVAAMRIPGCVVYAGGGFSPGVLHMLKSSEDAAYCLPNPRDLGRIHTHRNDELLSTWQLDHVLAVTFAWWDLIDTRPRSAAQLPLAFQEPPLRKSAAEIWPALIAAVDEQLAARNDHRPPRRAASAPKDEPGEGIDEIARVVAAGSKSSG